MSRSSEEVLLIVSHVRFKKVEGSLYLMGERMAWMQENKDSFSGSHKYRDIKAQKISSESKEKVQLQILLHDGSSIIYHFTNPMGRSAQFQDRDSIKELLLQLLPHFRPVVSSELEEKSRILGADPELLCLYNSLVPSGVITPNEFWANYAEKSNSKKKESTSTSQVVGVSPAFLADIKPQTDGCNGFKYSLTPDIIESIFKTYPMVRKKYDDYVPHQMTEISFWTKFFQSHYYHRDSLPNNAKDIFTECAKADDEEMKKELTKKISDPFVNLAEFQDTSLEEEYRGVLEDKRPSLSVLNQSMIKRFNQHSAMVLRACQTQTQAEAGADKSKAEAATNGTTSHCNGQLPSTSRQPTPTPEPSSQPPSKKARIHEKLVYEDLEPEKRQSTVSLRLGRLDGYLHGPTPVTATSSAFLDSQQLMEGIHHCVDTVAEWQPQLPCVLSRGQAIDVVGELSPGGLLMHGSNIHNLNQMIPVEMQAEVKAHYQVLGELLRHFWSCFPTSTKALEEKVVKMRETLEKFQHAKLYPLRELLSQNHFNVNMVSHMEEMLQSAYAKFDAWQARKLMRR